MGVHENSDNVTDTSPPLDVTRNGIIDDAEELCAVVLVGGHPDFAERLARKLSVKIEIFRQVQVNFVRGYQSNGDR